MTDTRIDELERLALLKELKTRRLDRMGNTEFICSKAAEEIDRLTAELAAAKAEIAELRAIIIGLDKRIEVAKSEAEARGREQGLEEAAVMAENMNTGMLNEPHEFWRHGFAVAKTAISKACRALKEKPNE